MSDSERCKANYARLLGRSQAMAPEIAAALARWDLVEAAELTRIALRLAVLAGEWKRGAARCRVVDRRVS